MAEDALVLEEVDDRGIAQLTLNRPDARNAMSNALMEQLKDSVQRLGNDDAIRAVVLTGSGDVFCAGGDLKGMQRQATNTREGRISDASDFAATLRQINEMPKLLIGRINGPAFGGGVGLMSLCDITIGLSSANYRLTEVTLGLIAATISPYVVDKIGVPNARRMMLNALPLDGRLAKELGLLDVVVDSVADLDAAVETEIQHVLKCAPGAVGQSKKLIQFVGSHDAETNFDYTVTALADAWESEEIKEGIGAFLGKRKPKWVT